MAICTASVSDCGDSAVAPPTFNPNNTTEIVRYKNFIIGRIRDGQVHQANRSAVYVHNALIRFVMC